MARPGSYLGALILCVLSATQAYAKPVRFKVLPGTKDPETLREGANGSSAFATTLQLSEAVTAHALTTKEEHEFIVTLRYQMNCAKKADEESGMIASVQPGGKIARAKLRIALYPERREFSALLGPGPKDPEENPILRLDAHPSCHLQTLEVEISSVVLTVDAKDGLDSAEWQRLAVKHSPFLVLRPDQVQNPHTDMPLVMGYSVHQTEKNPLASLKYTVVFSDEDSKPSEWDTDGQMARYGRRSDIEWVYEVQIDTRTLRASQPRFHGGLVKNYGSGHGAHAFSGSYLPNTQHPVLYNVESPKHNVFSDAPWSGHKAAPLHGHHLLADQSIASPQAREFLHLIAPWTMTSSDREMRLEKKLSRPSTDYLYVLLRGTKPLSKGALVARITFADEATSVISGESSLGKQTSNLDRLGEDLWQRQAFTAVPVGRKRAEKLGTAQSPHGELSLESVGYRTPDLELDPKDPVRVYRLVGSADSAMKFEDITSLFKITGTGLLLKATF